LVLSRGQIQYVKELVKFDIPLILIIISGRPRLLEGCVEASQAVINAYVPGPLGGQAIVETIFGLNVPSGRLPYTYPKYPGDIPYPYYHKPGDMCFNNEQPGPCQVSESIYVPSYF
jgi:beta-glucosidase